MKRKIFIFCTMLLSITCHLHSQKEYYNWYFGDHAGITFLPNGINPTALTDSKMFTYEASSVVSDTNGNLVFYTNGQQVWNKKHIQMPNGFGLNGRHESTQGSLVVQKPGDQNIFYIFTTDARPGEGNSYGLCYSIIDMKLDNRLGNISQKNIQLFSPACEKITAAVHKNLKDIWVVSHRFGANEFYSYLVTDSGVSSTPIVSRSGTNNDGVPFNYVGALKMSSDWSKIALAIYDKSIFELFDFDNSNGTVSHPLTFYSANYHAAYSVEFSPDNTKLYLSVDGWNGDSKLYQVNLKAGSDAQILNSVSVITTGYSRFGALQLGPDKKIYHATDALSSLGVINKPNELSNLCDYKSNAVDLKGNTCYWGLPNFAPIPINYIDPCNSASVYAQISALNTLCEGDTLFFSSNVNTGSQITWSGPDGFSSSFPDPVIPNVTKAKSGRYYLTAKTGSCVAVDSIDITIKKRITTKIISNTVCIGDTLFLKVSTDYNYNFKWSGPNGFSDTKHNTFLKITSEKQFGVYKLQITGNDLCVFVDSVKIEGFERQNFILSLPDTSAFPGAKDFHIPVYITTDSKSYPVNLSSVKFDIEINKKVYNPISSTKGSYTISSIDSLNIISIDIGNILLNSQNEIVTEITGDLLKDSASSLLVFKSLETQKTNCQNIKSKDGSLNVTCDLTAFDYQNFLNTVDISLAGQAVGKLNDYIRLANTKYYQSAAMWYNKLIPVNKGFTSKFRFRFSEGSNNGYDDGSLPGADGIAFVIQNNDAKQCGLSGGGIGYDGIPNSIAIEFDTYSNDSTQIENFFDPNGNHAAIQSNGTKPNTSKHFKPAMLAMNDKILQIKSDGTIYHVKVYYNYEALQFSIFLDTTGDFKQPPILQLDNFDLSKTINLKDGIKAYIGITSATGAAWQNHDILSWETCPQPSSPPISFIVSNDNFEHFSNVYPNPFTNQLNINFPSNNSEDSYLRIFNDLGELVYNSMFLPGILKVSIETGNFPIGCYYMQILCGDKSEYQSLIKL